MAARPRSARLNRPGPPAAEFGFLLALAGPAASFYQQRLRIPPRAALQPTRKPPVARGACLRRNSTYNNPKIFSRATPCPASLPEFLLRAARVYRATTPLLIEGVLYDDQKTHSPRQSQQPVP